MGTKESLDNLNYVKILRGMSPQLIFSYKLRYIVLFGLIEMARWEMLCDELYFSACVIV